MRENDSAPWFPKMRYGIGWGLPVTWQGWAVFLGYGLLSFLGFLFLQGSPLQIPLSMLYFLVVTLAFVFVVWKKGEKLDT